MKTAKEFAEMFYNTEHFIIFEDMVKMIQKNTIEACIENVSFNVRVDDITKSVIVELDKRSLLELIKESNGKS